jgi:putative endonuclease
MASASRVLYVGVTNDLERRVWEHKAKLIPGFTRQYNVTRLVHFEEYADIRDAIAREKQIKGWLRRKKIALIEEHNGTWKDLAWDWFRPSPSPKQCHPERSEGPRNRSKQNTQATSPPPPRATSPSNSSAPSASLERSFASLRMTDLRA